MSERLHRSVLNMISSAMGFIGPTAVTFITIPLLLHALGDAAYGIQVLASIIVGYFTVLDLGLDLPIIKFLAEDCAKKDFQSANRLLSTTLQVYLVVGFIGAMVTFLAAGVLARSIFRVPEDQVVSAIWAFRIAGIGFIFSLLMAWGRAIAVGLQRLEISSGVSGATTIVGAIVGLMVVYAGFGVVGYVFTRVVVTAIASLVYVGAAKRLLPELRLRLGLERAVVRRMSAFVGYGMVYRMSNAFLSRIDQVMIGAWIGVAQAGVYSLPACIVPQVIQLIASVVTLFTPLTSELQGLNQLSYLRDLFIRSARFTAAAATMCFVPLLVFGDQFMRLWAGAAVAQTTNLVFIFLLAAGYLATLAMVLLTNVLIGLGRMKEFSLYVLCRSLFLALVCFLLIPRMGLMGAGIAQVLSGIVDLGFMFYCLPRFLEIEAVALLKVSYLKPVMLGLGIGAVMWGTKSMTHSWVGLIAGVGLFELIYVSAAFTIGVFADTEKRALHGIWQAVSRRMQASQEG